MDKIEKIFKKHWEYYSKQGAETLKQQSGQIEQVSGDYQGRVLYELLQNAFDKAKENILVDVDEEYLYVANDDKRFSFTESYDYDTGKSIRGDFQSLCSISTSTKNASTSIGNKGVGFKSVYTLNNFADVFVKPLILGQEDISLDNWICFRVFDEIMQINDDVKKINDEQNNIENQLDNIQKEYPNRGIPGFCYPILLENEQLENFDEFVTVIRVKHNKKIEDLLEEIERIHFNFISLKYRNQLKIQIKGNNKETKGNDLVKITLKNIEELSKKTTIKIDKPHVAIKYKNESNQYDDLIYNYMPTKVTSPFSQVDFHGDFQSTVDRKGIDLGKGNIAEYNKALLQACIELHFLTLSNYLKNSDIELNLEFIDKNNSSEVEFDRDNFWKYLQLNDSTTKQQTVNIIINKILKKANENESFKNFYSFISKLAIKYFNKSEYEITLENINDFWEVVFNYFDIWRGNNGTSMFARDWIRERFNDAVIKPFVEEKIKCIPITAKNNDKEELKAIKSFNDIVFYKESNNNTNISIPSNLNISITEYSFFNNAHSLATESQFKDLQFKKFTNYNEILKHFRQIPKDDNLGNNKIDEATQKNIINTIFQIYLSKKESNFLSTHRYEELLSNKSNKDYTKIAANFAISTIFLKIKDQKLYKPSQHCHHSELDKGFLELQIPDDKKDNEIIDNFLKFLGVSFDENIRYVDYDKNEFFEGLNYIPFLITDTNIQEESSKTSYIPNMKIQYKGDLKHPALFYKTSTYKGILQEIKSKETERDSLTIVVKKLEDYPKKYIEKLVDSQSQIQNLDCNIVFKLYSEIFKQYSEKYLVYTVDGKFKWIKELNKTIYIAETKEDFELLKNKTDILATFSDVEKNEKLKDFQAKIKKSINMDGEAKNSIKQQLDILIPYILLSISKSDKESRKDFLEDEKNELKVYFEKWQKLEFKQLDQIELKIKIDGKEELKSSELFKPILVDEAVYYRKENELYDFASVVADFFKVGTLQTNIENILLKSEKSRDSFDVNEIEQISSRWINIDDDTKKRVIEGLKNIGFRDDISFKLRYFKSDLKESADKSSSITQSALQKGINNIINIDKLKNLNITFNCEDENSVLINKLLDKYKLIELSIDTTKKVQLIQKIYLKEEDIFDIFDKTKEQLDTELEQQEQENLIDEYKIAESPETNGEEPQSKSTNIETTARVDNFSTNHHSARNIKIAQNRGLKIEEELVKELSTNFSLKDLKDLIQERFKKIEEETVADGKCRYILKNKNRYQELLNKENTKLSDLLHMSKILGDGLGFDILYPIKNNGVINLLKVEVKSSSDGKSIYLSENERKQILLSKAKEDGNFRIYLYIKGKNPQDITQTVISILNNNNFSNITAETWIIHL